MGFFIYYCFLVAKCRFLRPPRMNVLMEFKSQAGKWQLLVLQPQLGDWKVNTVPCTEKGGWAAHFGLQHTESTDLSALNWSSRYQVPPWHSATGWPRRQSQAWCAVGITVLCGSCGDGKQVPLEWLLTKCRLTRGQTLFTLFLRQYLM